MGSSVNLHHIRVREREIKMKTCSTLTNKRYYYYLSHLDTQSFFFLLFSVLVLLLRQSNFQLNLVILCWHGCKVKSGSMGQPKKCMAPVMGAESNNTLLPVTQVNEI